MVEVWNINNSESLDVTKGQYKYVQPKQSTIKGEIPQHHHRFASSLPPPKWVPFSDAW